MLLYHVTSSKCCWNIESETPGVCAINVVVDTPALEVFRYIFPGRLKDEFQFVSNLTYSSR